MFESIRAIGVYVTDRARAKRFYTEVLGFEVSADLDPGPCFLRSENGRVHIYLEGGKTPSAVDRDSCRLSFFLQAEQSAAETHAALRAAGVTLLQDAPETVDDRTACFQLLDPDGNILEVCGRR